MKAVAVYPNQRQTRVIDYPEPGKLAAGEVRLRMLEVGICGTDREIASFQYGEPPAGSEYLVLGHESLAEVLEVGPGVAHTKEGDLVVPTVRRPCPHEICEACRHSRQDFCFTGDFTERGIKQHHGFMATQVVEQESYLAMVPRALREIAVLVEPLTVAEKALEQLRAVSDRLPWAGREHMALMGRGHHAVVLGAGPVGLLGAMALRAHGFEVAVFSRASAGDRREEIVHAIGAEFLHADEVSIQNVVERFGHTLDLVYEAVGASQLAFQFLNALGPNGVFIFTGVPGRKAPVAVDTDLLMRNLVLKNQLVFGTVNAPKSCFDAAVRDLAYFQQNWPGAVRGLITHRMEMEEAIGNITAHGSAGGIKNVVAVA